MTTSEKKLSVLLADDIKSYLIGFKDILAFASEEIEVVGMAESAESAVRMTAEKKPDVIMLDMNWGRDDTTLGVMAIQKIRQVSPETRILAHTAYYHLIDIARKAGAHKAFSKLDLNSLEEITRAIHDTYDCFTVLVPVIPEEVSQNFARLTTREKEVLELMCKGHSNKQIAEELTVSNPTVKHHVSEILSELCVTSRTEAVSLVNQYHLLDN